MSPLRTLLIALLCAYPGLSQTAPRPANPGFQALVQDAKTRIREVNATELKGWLDSDAKPKLIDVREDGEWQEGHATAAVHIGRGVLEREIEAAVPEKATRIVLYCAGGHRSALAADSLQKMGYTNVFSLAGGFQSYRTAGLPVQK